MTKTTSTKADGFADSARSNSAPTTAADCAGQAAQKTRFLEVSRWAGQGSIASEGDFHYVAGQCTRIALTLSENSSIRYPPQ